MSPLWTSQEAAAATSGRATAPFAATGLSIDSRGLTPGDLFIALTDRRDGHEFVAAAFEAGAAAAMVTHRPEGVGDDAPLLIVDDVPGGLRDLARAARQRTAARVIGITGSVGKTSTKDMLRHVLGAQGQVHAAEKSFNNHWGVPLTLARCPADAAFAVIEIGMNAPGEIAPLARLAALDVAVITTVAPAHLEAFADGLDGIAREKASIFEGLVPGGTAIYPCDLSVSPILEAVAIRAAARSRRVGTAPDATDQVRDVRLEAGCTHATLVLASCTHLSTLPTLGRHFAQNALAAVIAAEVAGADAARAAADLATWRPPSGRGTAERLHLAAGPVTLLDDAYNANPASMAAGLDALAATDPEPGGHRIAILGDMLELGASEAALHAALAEVPAMAQVHRALCVGPRMAALHAALPPAQRAGHVPDAEAAVARLPDLIGPGDVVLVKGSLGSRVSHVVAALRAMDGPATLTQGPP